MSDKNLTESEWKKFSKAKDFKDSAFVKALAALEKAKTPALQRDALADLEKQADSLRKAHKADKELDAYLDGLDTALDKERKLLEAQARKAEEASSEDDEEEETPALLTTKMVPLLRQVRKGEEMRVLLAVAGKEVAVLLTRRPVAPARRKLLTDYLDNGTPKFFAGSCIFEEAAYTFVLKTQAAGLAKKVKAALLKQVELRLKVRVRGEDPDDIDDDGDPAEDAPGAEPNAAAPARAKVDPKDGAPAAAPAEDPLQAQFDKRMAEIEPKVLAAFKAQGADVSKIRAVADFVRDKGASAQYKAALAGMDSLTKLLDAARAAVPAAPAGPAEAAPATPAAPRAQTAAFTARLAALMPSVKAAIAAAGPHAPDIKSKVSAAGAAAQKQDFDAADRLLDETQALLQNAGDAAAAPPASADAQRLDARLAEVEPRYLAVLAKNPSDATRLRAVFGFAKDQQDAGQPVKAAAALDQLERLMTAAEASLATAGAGSGDTGYQGLVAYRKTLLDFRASAATVKTQIAALKAAIPSQLPEQQDLADELAGSLNAYNEELLDIVDDAMNAAENVSSPATRALAAQIDTYIQQLASDPLVAHADANPFGASVNIQALLGNALADIRKAMPALS